MAGIVGAGGNVGAVIYAQFLLRSGSTLENSFMYFGIAVVAISLLGLGIKFSQADEDAAVDEQKKLETISLEMLTKKKRAA